MIPLILANPRSTGTLRHAVPVFLGMSFALSSAAIAQQPAPRQAVTAKRPINHGDYDSWRTIQGQRLSNDGKFLVYTLVPEEGDGVLVLRTLIQERERRYGIGFRPPAAPADDDETGGAPGTQPAALNPAFSGDMRFVVFQVRPLKAETDQAKNEKRKPDDQPKNALGLMNLADGQVTRIDRVKSFQVPDSGSSFVAYLMEARAPTDSAKPAPTPRGQKRIDYGTDLVLRNLGDASERTFPGVLEYSLSRDGRTLVYLVSSKTDQENGVYAVTPGTTSAPVALLAGRGKYRRISWDEKQRQLAFLADRSDSSANGAHFTLYHWDRKSASATELVSSTTPNFRPGRVISERGAIEFSDDGNNVFFGVALPPEPEKDTSSAGNEEKVMVDLWHWKDDFIQPMQKVRATQERNRSYRTVFHRAERQLTPLADETMQTVNPTSDGRWAVGSDDRAYRTLVGVDVAYADFFLVNTADGNRTPVLQKHRGNVTLSPTGQHALFYRDKDWYVLSIPDGRITNLTKELGVAFYQEDYDSPSPPPAWGNAGWTSDEKYVLLNDRYDVWQVAGDGSGARNLTDGVGRKEKIIFRYTRLDAPEPGGDKGIDPAKPLLLAAESEWTREEGFYRDRIDGGPPQKLIWGPRTYANVTRARDADVVLFTAGSFTDFPDLQVTTSDFKAPTRVSDANPQKSGLVWGTSELVRYKNSDGVPLSGILMKPENFDPTKKYPMVVYIYEKLTQNVNRFVNPAPGTSINPMYYVSNGYLVFEPDIVYTIGYPGQSALKCVLPAIQAVVDKGFVDESNIGIQGHSWGGYQIAYMVTQTNRFKAAAPGAVVANMTSAYSGIRWGSGLPRQFQYEHTQSRIGGTIWEYPMRFVENSPLFQLDRVQTPILTIHNDGDDAVPWYQGIEFFLGLRRLGKEVYLFSYNGEPHGLRKRVDQEDYTRRLQQFFDHYLKGAPAPDWMEKGIPFLDKDKINTTSEALTN